mmetsp:Transcript_11126/g.32038  ORF Transcript_11126/g.32038 Transcript_11126/m.32038 type:complete len:213 (+) Transcript_11126:59-697(+)
MASTHRALQCGAERGRSSLRGSRFRQQDVAPDGRMICDEVAFVEDETVVQARELRNRCNGFAAFRVFVAPAWAEVCTQRRRSQDVVQAQASIHGSVLHHLLGEVCEHAFGLWMHRAERVNEVRLLEHLRERLTFVGREAGKLLERREANVLLRYGFLRETLGKVRSLVHVPYILHLVATVHVSEHDDRFSRRCSQAAHICSQRPVPTELGFS